jgi:PIN domain nuclease of toxin-antitoxin system
MRLLLDTHIYVYMVNEPDRLTRDVRTLLEDAENLLYLSAESVHELVTIYRAKGVLKDKFRTETDLIEYVFKDYAISIDFPDAHVFRQLAALRINEGKDHGDPVDHLIISQAIAHHMTLISSDTKFPFYRAQGLELVENR